MLKILITGDRNWLDCDLVRQTLREAMTAAGVEPHQFIVIHGGAKGADRCAQEACFMLHCNVRAYPADWEGIGRAAGPIRNQQMLTENPDISLVIAFHDNLKESKGTKHMVSLARKAHIPTMHIAHVVSRTWLLDPEVASAWSRFGG